MSAQSLLQAPAVEAASTAVELGLPTLVARSAFAAALGFGLALVYRATHRGLSYSQSFTQTLVYITVIVALVMLTVRNSLATAFTLVGALSIIRFRTVVKDTRDTAFVFAALAVGMATGLGYLDLAGLGAAAVAALAGVMHVTNFGHAQKGEFVLRLRFANGHDTAAYLQPLAEFARRSNLLHVEPAADGGTLRLAYDLALRSGKRAEDLVAALGRAAGVSEVVLLVSKNDVDY